MNGARLLIDIEVLEFLRTLRRREQEYLLNASAKLPRRHPNFQISLNVIYRDAVWMFMWRANLPSNSGMTLPTIM